MISSYSLTCIEIDGNKYDNFKFLPTYKFVPRCTNVRTFGMWTPLMQRIIPTIAYHCQMLVGVENSTYSDLMGKIDCIKKYRNGLQLALIFEVVIVAGITFKFSKRWPKDNDLYLEGYKKFIQKFPGCNDYSIEKWVIWDKIPLIEDIDQRPLLSMSSALSTEENNDDISSRTNINSTNNLNYYSTKTHFTHEEINAYFNNV